MSENLKDIFKDDKTLADKVDGFFDNTLNYSRQMLERIWWRNILFYCGEQWIEYVRSQQTFRRRSIPFYVPTPVSNEIREYVRTIRSLLLSQKMIPRIWPNTNEREDIEAAELGEKLLVSMESIRDYEIKFEKEKMCIWLALAGTAFIRTYPYIYGGKVYFIDDKMKSTGEVVTEHIIPFNVYLDYQGDSLNKKRWMGIKSLKPREWVEDTFNVKIPDSDNVSMTSDFERRLMRLVSSVSPWKGQGLDTTTINDQEEDLVIYKEVEFAPTKKFPNGRYVATCSDKVLINEKRMPIEGNMENWYYTVTDFHMNYVPGRFWSDGGVNDLISPQMTINEIDQTIAIHRKGIGRPRLIVPGEVGLKKLNEGGHGFLAVTYNPLLSGGAAPQFVPGTPLNPEVLQEREIAKVQIQDVSGDPKNILRGQPPSAQSSGIQVDILRETAERGHSPDIERYHQSMNTVYKKRLLIAKEIYTEERLVKVVGRGNQIEIKKFKAADLRNNTDVRLELDSGLVTTKSGQTDVLLKMISSGFLGPSPTLREEVLRRLGLTGFTDEVDLDVELAEKENIAVVSGEIPVFLADRDPRTGSYSGDSEVLNDDPTFKYHNHGIHYETHRRFIMSMEFRELPLKIQTILMAHADIHHEMMMAEIKKQQQEMLLMGEMNEPQAGKKEPQETPEKVGSVQRYRPQGNAPGL